MPRGTHDPPNRQTWTSRQAPCWETAPLPTAILYHGTLIGTATSQLTWVIRPLSAHSYRVLVAKGRPPTQTGGSKMGLHELMGTKILREKSRGLVDPEAEKQQFIETLS